MGGLNVVLPLEVAGDRRDLIGLDDQVRLEALNGLPRLLGRALIRIADCHKCCRHRASLMSTPGDRGVRSPINPGRLDTDTILEPTADSVVTRIG